MIRLVEGIIDFVFIIVGWEVGKFLYNKIKWKYMVNRGTAAKITTKDGGVFVIISNKDQVSKMVKMFSNSDD